MKTVSVPALLASLSILLLPHAFGQGALTPPPGPPAPTMKSLDQVEPRIIVNATNTPGDATNTFIISAPGSYFLTGNITGTPGKNGISIQANDVTLDLNGFALVGAANPLGGVNTPGVVTNLCVRNGSIRGWATAGVRAIGAVALVEKLRLSGNLGIGVLVGNGSMIKDCVADQNGVGFYCTDRTQISHCISTRNGNGFYCTAYVSLLDCTSSRNAGTGIQTEGSCTVSRCSVTRNESDGLTTGPGCNISDCVVSLNVGQGISPGAGSSVRNCTVQSNTSNGILLSADRCYVVGNTCDGNDQGIAGGGRCHIEGNSCTNNIGYGFASAGFLIKNTARGNSPNYLGAGGQIVDVSTTGNIPANTSPWANFSY